MCPRMMANTRSIVYGCLCHELCTKRFLSVPPQSHRTLRGKLIIFNPHTTREDKTRIVYRLSQYKNGLSVRRCLKFGSHFTHPLSLSFFVYYNHLRTFYTPTYPPLSPYFLPFPHVCPLPHLKNSLSLFTLLRSSTLALSWQFTEEELEAC